jgi:hypothetical protein
MSLLQAGFGSSGEYTIDDSLRFRSSASAYLSRTFGSGNRKTYTFSLWVKRGILGGSTNQFFFGSGASATAGGFYFTPTNQLEVNPRVNNTNTYLTTTQVFRDPSAWYHIVFQLDTTQATSSDRLKLYVNGVQVTAFSGTVYPALNGDSTLNNNIAHWIGRYAEVGFPSPFDGYMTEFNFIDGQALDPTDFGEFDDNGTWKPLAYTGTYGTNGFYLNGVGVTDESGNGNDWTNNNLDLSTPTADTYDQMKDTPSLVDENAGNFCTWNPLRPNAAMSYANGNLDATSNGGSGRSAYGTFGMSSGKWYFETTGGDNSVGVATIEGTPYAIYTATGTYSINGTTTSSKATYITSDIIGCAYDADGGNIEFFKNGVSQGSSSFTAGLGLPVVAQFSGTISVTRTCSANFGQRPFAYTPPSGFLKLNTFNLPDSTIEKGSDYFNTVLYTGNGSTQSITGVGFQPDWTWIKNRDAADAHVLTDAVRGATEELQSNATSAETTNADGLTAFDTDGFSLGADVLYNTSSEAYVAWNWLASNTTASNTVGSITSTVSVNTTSGFSIVSYTGTGANATVGHGLGVAPSMMIVKGRDSAGSWAVYHANANASPASGRLYLQLTNAFTAQATAWNSTVPSSTVFSVGSLTDTNQNTNAMIAYCFAEVPGYSAIGSYTGNGLADGAFVYTGMRPSFLLWKRTNSTGNWTMMDSTRNTYNVLGERLYANLSNAGSDGTIIDFVSNGFKLRVNANDQNGSGSTYIYLAFAENPFKNSNAR